MTKILIVDDEQLILRSLSRELDRIGFEVVTHQGGFGFIEAVREHQPTVVLLDVSMPGLAGNSALRALDGIADRYGIATIVLLHSALDPARLRALVVQSSAAGFIQKPKTADELASVIRRHLANELPAETG